MQYLESFPVQHLKFYGSKRETDSLFCMLLPHGHMELYVVGTICCFISLYASVV
jgi:hypothetical protein